MTDSEQFTKGSEAQRTAKESTKQMMLDRLGGDENLASKLTPDWEVGCRRATPFVHIISHSPSVLM